MSIAKRFLIGAALLTGGVALAHHIPVPLSHADGKEILTDVVLYSQPKNVGVPGYIVSTVGHEDEVALTDGASFSVHATGGLTETVVFQASDFPDIAHATDEQVVVVINSQLTIAVAETQNGFFALRAVEGGPGHSISLAEGPGRPLLALGFEESDQSGSDAIEMVLSIPSDGHEDDGADKLAQHPYLVFASSGEGSFLFHGVEVPIARDHVTASFIQAVREGELPSFFSRLNEGADARAVVSLDQVQDLLGTDLPDELHFAYVVFSPDYSSVEFVSNRFTVHVVE